MMLLRRRENPPTASNTVPGTLCMIKPTRGLTRRPTRACGRRLTATAKGVRLCRSCMNIVIQNNWEENAMPATRVQTITYVIFSMEQTNGEDRLMTHQCHTPIFLDRRGYHRRLGDVLPEGKASKKQNSQREQEDHRRCLPGFRSLGPDSQCDSE